MPRFPPQTTAAEYLIAPIERVNRGIVEAQGEPVPDTDEVPLIMGPGDVLRVVLIGIVHDEDIQHPIMLNHTL
jgi:hypothetical protein